MQLFGGWLRITAGQAVPFPKSGGIESGVVVKGEHCPIDEVGVEMALFVKPSLQTGELTITDESGKTTTLREGESFYIQRGSIITWSAERFALMYKCSAYPPGSQP